MDSQVFAALDAALAGRSPLDAFALVADQCRAEQNYALLFETKLMQRRFELGLPLIQTDGNLPSDKQAGYEQFMVETAREVGTLFLETGQIERAFPYFRAIGDLAPVSKAIESVEPGDNIEGIIEIAFQQGLHPVKGIDLILKQYGMCRAITLFGMYGVSAKRSECMALISSALYQELLTNLRDAVKGHEGAEPAGAHITELIDGRDWLFGEYDYYVDTSHLNSVVQYAAETQDPATLELISEMCAYGRKLSMPLHIRGNPPFDNPFVDYGKYADALLGRDVEGVIAHFREKIAQEPEESMPAQVLVHLLLKLDRAGDALAVAREHLSEVPASYLTCPTPLQLAHKAGEYFTLAEMAREREDPLSYIAARLLANKTAS
ncbi:MAG: hypothetical protein JNK87_20280 [Bryobacterales bacterium]|nr:hypothetical protein [Bryobacterales bacterium]